MNLSAQITELAYDLRACDYHDQVKLKPYPVYWVWAISYLVKWQVMRIVCYYRGCKYEDSGSYAGPEGAAEHFCCMWKL